MTRASALAVVVAGCVVVACGPGPETEPKLPVTELRTGAGAHFGFEVVRDGVVVGASAHDPLCPPLSVALRLPDDDGTQWIDVTDPVPRADVETLGAVSIDENGVVALADASGVVRGHAVVDVTDDGDEGFVDVDVQFDADEVDVAYVAACFALADGEHVVGGGERFSGPDLRKTIAPIVFSAPGETASGTNEAHVPVPFFATTRGLGVLVESERVGAFDVDVSVAGALQVRFQGNRLPLRLRGASKSDDGERVTDNVKAHARRMGLPKPPPSWALLPMQWRNDLDTVVEGGVVVDSGTDFLHRDVDEIIARGLPFGSVWIDAPWETGYNTFVVNEVQLPDFDDAVARLDDEGLRPIVWATEHVNTSDDSEQAVGMPSFASRELFELFEAQGFLVVDAQGEPFTFPWGRGQGAFVDFSNDAACDAWIENMRPLLERGVHGFKLDYGESMRPDVLGLLENTIPVFHDGSTNRVMHTRYARLYHECYVRGLEAVHGDDWFIITRTGGIYDQKNGVAIWPGDVDSDLQRFGEPDDQEDGAFGVGGLPSAIGAYLSLAMSGYPLYGADIGGYRGDRATPEEFSRWAEFSSLSTIFQVGGGSNQAAWDPDYDDPVTGVADPFAAAVRTKASLWPMFERWIAQASTGGDGSPVVVPLGVFMGEDAAGWADKDAFVVGSVVAAYPVVVAGARDREVRLPRGAWHRISSGEKLTGPTTATVDAGLGEMPVFLRAGAALVLDPESQTLLPSTRRVSSSLVRQIVVAPGPDSSVSAGGLVVAQHTDGDTVVVTVSGVQSALLVDLLALREGVNVDGGVLEDVSVDGDVTRVVAGADGTGDVTLTFRP